MNLNRLVVAMIATKALYLLSILVCMSFRWISTCPTWLEGVKAALHATFFVISGVILYLIFHGAKGCVSIEGLTAHALTFLGIYLVVEGLLGFVTHMKVSP